MCHLLVKEKDINEKIYNQSLLFRWLDSSHNLSHAWVDVWSVFVLCACLIDLSVYIRVWRVVQFLFPGGGVWVSESASVLLFTWLEWCNCDTIQNCQQIDLFMRETLILKTLTWRVDLWLNDCLRLLINLYFFPFS